MNREKLQERIIRSNETYDNVVDEFLADVGIKNIFPDEIKDKLCRMMLCLFADWYKEQMMKDAEPAEIGFWNQRGLSIHFDKSLERLGFDEDEKVKVIIVKEAEK